MPLPNRRVPAFVIYDCYESEPRSDAPRPLPGPTSALQSDDIGIKHRLRRQLRNVARCRQICGIQLIASSTSATSATVVRGLRITILAAGSPRTRVGMTNAVPVANSRAAQTS